MRFRPGTAGMPWSVEVTWIWVSSVRAPRGTSIDAPTFLKTTGPLVPSGPTVTKPSPSSVPTDGHAESTASSDTHRSRRMLENPLVPAIRRKGLYRERGAVPKVLNVGQSSSDRAAEGLCEL